MAPISEADPRHPMHGDAPGTARPGRWARPGALAAAVIAVAVAAHLPAVQGDFFSDDVFYITKNVDLVEIPLSQSWRVFAGRSNPWEYLPVRDLSYRLDVAMFGLSPLGYHLENVLLYALACGACFLAVRAVVRLLRAERDDAFEHAVVVAAVAVFAAHPAHVESVAWIAGRKDLLSGLFALAALWQLSLALAPDRPSWRRLSLASLLYALALLSKASVLPLAPLALLLALARHAGRAPWRAAVVRSLAVAAPFVALAAASLWLSLHFTAVRRAVGGQEAYVAPIPLALRILGTFAHIAVAPYDLRFHYDVRVPGLAGAALVASGVATAAAAAVGALALVARRSIAGLGAATFALFSIPFLQLVPFIAWSEACERFLFMPTLGLGLAAGALLGWAFRRGALRLAAVAAAIGVAGGIGATAYRSWEWASNARLVEASIARSPGHPSAATLGFATLWEPRLDHVRARAAALRIENPSLRARFVAIADGWRALVEGRFDDARRLVAQMSAVPPGTLTAEMEAKLAERAGDDFAALRLFAVLDDPEPTRRIQERHRPELEALRTAVAQRPRDVELLAELGNLESELLLDERAATTYRRILEIAPELHAVRYNLGQVLKRGKLHAAAAAEYRLAAPAMPRAWYDVGVCEEALGNVVAAEAAFRNALAADPRDWRPAFELGRTYQTAGRAADAREAFRLVHERAQFAPSGERAAVEAALAHVE